MKDQQKEEVKEEEKGGVDNVLNEKTNEDNQKIIEKLDANVDNQWHLRLNIINISSSSY